MYKQGQGVPQDYSEAVKWILMAAEPRNASKQFDAHYWVENQENNFKDYSQVLEWQLSYSNLSALNLSCNKIKEYGAQALANALKTNLNLTNLDLQNNSVGENIALALSETLKINLTLTTLDLGYTWCGANGSQALSEALKINSTLIT
ncbi:hypothetical protein BGZ74_006316, partial [Mortierella antarctica]